MTAATALPPSVRATAFPTSAVSAVEGLLEEHRRARADQIEALLWIREHADECDVDASELAVARAALADVESALRDRRR
jgi:hypothetical protein